MIAAHQAVQRPQDARLLVVDAGGHITRAPRSRLFEFLRSRDLVIANDAATLPASLHGVHLPSGAEIEVRLAGGDSLATSDVHTFVAVVFGAGDFRTRTEDRPLPPPLAPGDRLVLGSSGDGALKGCATDTVTKSRGCALDTVAQAFRPADRDRLSATIEALLDHPRLVSLRFGGSASAVWAGLGRHGRPIQYAHVPTPLGLWDVWTPIAGVPVAFEPPSAGFALDWDSIRAMRARGVAFATVTLAAGISSTGDPALDRRLPFDEPYRIPESTASAIRAARTAGGRIIAVGTTVVRAVEHAAAINGLVRPGEGIANQRVGPGSRLRVVDAILSGTHEPGSSHYQLLRAFVDDATLSAATAALEVHGFRTHEFGDSVLIEKRARAITDAAGVGDPRNDLIATAA